MVATTVVAGIYAVISFLLSPGVDVATAEERILIIRIITMYTTVIAGNLITDIERTRRREAVVAAQRAERELQMERIRISKEVHDLAANSAFSMGLGLETCVAEAPHAAPQLSQRLKVLHTQAKQLQWELRYLINLGPIFEGRGLAQMLRSHAKNFGTLTSIPTVFTSKGREVPLTASVKQKIFSVTHNALTNAYKHAQASRVVIEPGLRKQHSQTNCQRRRCGNEPR